MPSIFRVRHRVRNAVAVAAIGVLAALPAMAQGTGPDLGLGYATAIGLTTTDVRTTISRIISYFLGFLGIIAIGIMLYAGFLWMTAGGNEEKIRDAKKWMVNGTIGLVIIMASFAITQFIFRAVEEGSQGGSSGGCPPGQVCGGGGFGGGGLGLLKITGITPFGPGPGNKGWPKNYAIQAYFNANLAAPTPPSTIPPTWLAVTKCNKRVDGSGAPQPYDGTACSTPVDGTLSITGNALIFKPNPVPPGQFEGDFWYFVRLQGGAVKDVNGRVLTCPLTPPGPTGDISSTQAQVDLCDRAVAINDLVDVTPPTVTVDAPKSPPAYCFSGTNPYVVAHALASDDFLVASVGYLLDTATDHLVDVNGDPLSNSVNAGLVNPFTADTVNVDISALAAGPHKITAVAQDGVPQPSTVSESDFTVNPPHCCNAVKDAAQGETDVDCGGECGACVGAACTTDADCATGYCDPATKTCQEKPVIDSIDVPGPSPMTGNTGTLITIHGRYFGPNPGSITFLGPPGVDAQACNPAAWTDTQVVVAVPTGAATGPLKLTAAYGAADQTDDTRGPNLGAFTVGGSTYPGICYLSPSQGNPGSQFDINGTGFGATIGASTVAMGSYPVTVATGGWTDPKITAIVPTAPEKTYSVTATIGGKTTNAVDYVVAPVAAAGQPRVTGVIPESGPIGTYVTVQGSNFGYLKGTVYFKFKGGALHCVGGTKNGQVCTKDADCTGGGKCSNDIAIADEPACSNNWHDNYIIVKVPKQYQDLLDLQYSAPPGVAHGIQVVTAAPAKTSNDDVTFSVTNEAQKPGICSFDPDNGRPGKTVQVSGEGFGSTGSFGPASAPKYTVEFYKSQSTTVTSTAYSSWEPTAIGTTVAGDFLTKSTWPNTGPAFVIANNVKSSNAVPFRIGDCNDAGATCPIGTQCCASGSCQGAPNYCAPPARNSAYGWIFSTNVLPELPVVVENAMCKHEPPPPEILQSPSPYKDSTDACLNAMGRVQFSAEMQADAGSLAANVSVKECGNGDSSACGTGTPVSVQFQTSDCDVIFTDRCKVVDFIPPNGYYKGQPYWKSGYWYQITLKSDPKNSAGFKEPGADGRYLDGNFDRQPGGDYVYQFRVSASDNPCKLDNVFVDPPEKTLDQDTDPFNFRGLPTGANCNILQCDNASYTISWLAQSYLDLTAFPPPPPPPAGNFCVKPVLAKAETGPTPTPLTAQMAPIGTSLTKEGTSEVIVKFAEPHVVEVSPIDGCNAACINAAIYAKFNVPMSYASLVQPGNIVIYRCRNSSCTAPYLSVAPAVRTIQVTSDGPPGKDVFKHFAFTGAGNLQPSTFYTVRIYGGPGGVTSLSGVPLAGLNDGSYYAWKFRTKDDPTACVVDHATVAPAASTLYYVGEKQDLTVNAFGSPDECNKSGQPLLADQYSWTWGFGAPNPVLGGFIDGDAGTPIQRSPVGTVVNTNPVPKAGCSSKCLYTGSQDKLPACGDGIKDPAFEECDPAGGLCSPRCLYTGTTSPTCGNGAVDAGETCDKTLRCIGGAKDGATCSSPTDCSGSPCDLAFPPGCKQPGTHVDGFDDARGCVWTGSSTSNGKSTCGDGFIGDGEACDDGNNANGDGCSSDCLFEGSGPTCSSAPTDPQCVSTCGNGKTEIGEDPSCEGGGGPVANGCNPHTCLKKGVPPCLPGQTSNCCGDGKPAEPGKDPECEAVGANVFCTSTCLLKGSSPFYRVGSTDYPSFCGDGIPGLGEKSLCEEAPDAFTDKYQVTVADPQPSAGFDAQTAAGSTSQVVATTGSIAAGNEGKANVAMSCTCKTQGDSQDDFCAAFNPALVPSLACADNGCCAQRPQITLVKPAIGANGVCRNPLITVSFDQVMDHSSVVQGISVAFQSAGPDCPDGTNKISLALNEAANGAPKSFWSKVWSAISSFFSEYVIRPVFGNATLPPNYSAVFCTVPAQIDVINEGEPTPTVSTAFISVKKLLPADTPVVVLVQPTVKSKAGVGLDKKSANAFKATYFGTDDKICTINSVKIAPPYMLFNSVNQPPIQMTAEADADDGQAIVSIPGVYEWAWEWTPLPIDSSAVIEPDPIVTSDFVRDSRVHGSNKTIDGSFVPKNGQALAEATAVVQSKKCVAGTKPGTVCAVDGDCGAGGTCQLAGTQKYPGSALITVFLCDNPWPDRKLCGGTNHVSLPWDAANNDACVVNARYWYPFYDSSTNFEFYYCRDGKGQGDSTPLLPSLHETPVIVNPGRDILKEYLFTYDTTKPLPDPSGAAWVKDALGLRISANPNHYGIVQWFADKGFTGGPQPTKVNGYGGLINGRTVYVNAAAMSPIGGGKNNLYTNIDILSKTDGSAPETDQIFTQILSLINFNRNLELRNFGICRQSAGGTPLNCNSDLDCHLTSGGVPMAGGADDICDMAKGQCVDKTTKIVDLKNAGTAVRCTYDLQCQVDADGKVVLDNSGAAARAAFVCDAAKDKLVRDVGRWSDFQLMRATANAKVAPVGTPGIPTLASGTFLVTRTNSAWPSWLDTFSGGFTGQMPQDPVNKHGWCLDNGGDPGHYDPTTCWNDTARFYKCPAKSHVYQYQYFQTGQGQNYRLDTDFETPNDSVKTWSGRTCPELPLVADATHPVKCSDDPTCVWEALGENGAKNSGCTYKTGKFDIYGVNVTTAICDGGKKGGSTVCGDGIVGPGETCEPGNTIAQTCTDGLGRAGFKTLTCAADCKGWTDTAPPDTCHAGSCGDGVVQAPEKCDDGPLNGTYGHCSKLCDGLGFYCGDGKRSPNEACDCGDKNGQYAFDGVVAPPTTVSCNLTASPAPSCAWDCSAAGPRCGDGIVQGTEDCDGNAQDFKGYCNDTAKTGCNTTADCPATFVCGSFCPTPEQHRHRSCVANDPSTASDNVLACTWGPWTCTAPGFCGNGTKETGEECDDGNDNNNDNCVIDPAHGYTCKKAICGDGYVDGLAGEQCDQGKDNGRLCKPGYGLNCTYCTAECKTAVISGGFCGDNVLQSSTSNPIGPEECEGSVGLDPNGWVCVSTRPEFQSFGVRTGAAVCNKKSCLRSCLTPESAVCPQTSSTSYGGAPPSWFLPDSGMQANRIIDSSGPLYEACDPDVDNDGVPKTMDCNDHDNAVHPGYDLAYTKLDGSAGSISIPTPAMVCNGKDNACNGHVNDNFILRGEVINARTGAGLQNAKFTLYCGNKPVFDGFSGPDKSADGHTYNFEVTTVDDGTCNGSFSVVPQNVCDAATGKCQVCADPDDKVVIPLSDPSLKKCQPYYLGNVVISTPAPGSEGDGAIATTYVQWGTQASGGAKDLDFYLKTSNAECVGYTCPGGSYGSAAGAKWDHDDTDWQGPETITFFSFGGGEKYRFFLNYYPDTPGSPALWGPDAQKNPIQVRYFDSSCAEQKIFMKTPINNADQSLVWWNAWTLQENGGKLQVIDSTNTQVNAMPGNP